VLVILIAVVIEKPQYSTSSLSFPTKDAVYFSLSANGEGDRG
jgi:hypothetical protein